MRAKKGKRNVQGETAKSVAEPKLEPQTFLILVHSPVHWVG